MEFGCREYQYAEFCNFFLILSSFPLLKLERRNRWRCPLPFPFFFEIIQVTSKPALCLQALPMHIHPFSGRPCTFHFLAQICMSSCLPSKPHPSNRMPSATSSPLFLQPCSSQHNCPAPHHHIHLPWLTSCPRKLLRDSWGWCASLGRASASSTLLSEAGGTLQHTSCKHTPAPHTCSLFWEAWEGCCQKTGIFQIKSLLHTQSLPSQGKVVWTHPRALPQPLLAMRLALLAQSSSRPRRETTHGLSLCGFSALTPKLQFWYCKHVVGLLLSRVCALKGRGFIQPLPREKRTSKNHPVQYSMREGAQMRLSNYMSNPTLKTSSDRASTISLRSLLQWLLLSL